MCVCSLKEQLLSLQSAVQRLQMGMPVAPLAAADTAATDDVRSPDPCSAVSPAAAAAVSDRVVGSPETPSSLQTPLTVSSSASADGFAAGLPAAGTASTSSSNSIERPLAGSSPASSVGSAVSPPPPALQAKEPLEEVSPPGCTPRPPARGARHVRHVRPDTPVPAPWLGPLRPAALEAPTAPTAPQLRPPGLPPRKRLLGGAGSSSPRLSQLPPAAAAVAQTSRIPRPAAGAPSAAASGEGFLGKPSAARSQVLAVGRPASMAPVTKVTVQSNAGVLQAHGPLSAIADPKNLTTAARRVTAPTSAEKAQLTGAASTFAEVGAIAKGNFATDGRVNVAAAKTRTSLGGEEPGAAAKLWVGGNPPAVAKVWGGGMASRLIRFARGNSGKGSPVETMSGSPDSGGSASVTRSERQRGRRPDTPHIEKRRSATSAVPQQRQ